MTLRANNANSLRIVFAMISIGSGILAVTGQAWAQNKPQPSSAPKQESGLSEVLRNIFGGAAPPAPSKAKAATRATRPKTPARLGNIKYDANGKAIEVSVVDVKRGRIPQSWDRQYYLEKAEAKRRARAKDAGV